MNADQKAEDLRAQLATLAAENERLHKQLELGTREMTTAADKLASAAATIERLKEEAGMVIAKIDRDMAGLCEEVRVAICTLALSHPARPILEAALAAARELEGT